MDDFEQIVFVLGAIFLIVLPFVFKVGYVNNTTQIAAWAKIQEGDFDEVKQEYTKRLKRNPMDVDRASR